MSEATFEEAREEAMAEERDAPVVAAEEAAPEGAGEGEGDAPAPKNWEKIAQDQAARAAAERTRRKAETQARRELEDRVSKMETERSAKGSDDPLEALVSQLRDDDDDPITDINGLKALVKQFVARERSQREQEQATTQQQRALQSVLSTMEEHEADFAADHPDYHDAAKHYRAERESELEELGYAGSDLKRALANDLLGVVKTALGAGRDPAEAIYKLANKRGFKSGAKEAAGKLDKIAESAQAGIRAGGGRGADNNLTMDSVSKLSGAAFDSAYAKLRAQNRKSA